METAFNRLVVMSTGAPKDAFCCKMPHQKEVWPGVKEEEYILEKRPMTGWCLYTPSSRKNTFTIMFCIEMIGILSNCYVLGIFCGYRIPKQFELLAMGLVELAPK